MVGKFETPQMNFLHTLNFQLSKRGQCRDQMTQNQTVLLLFSKVIDPKIMAVFCPWQRPQDSFMKTVKMFRQPT